MQTFLLQNKNYLLTLIYMKVEIIVYEIRSELNHTFALVWSIFELLDLENLDLDFENYHTSRLSEDKKNTRKYQKTRLRVGVRILSKPLNVGTKHIYLRQCGFMVLDNELINDFSKRP